MDNFNWGVRRPSLSHLEAGSNTSLSSASGFGQVKTFTQENRDDSRTRENKVEPRHKHSAKSRNYDCNTQYNTEILIVTLSIILKF